MNASQSNAISVRQFVESQAARALAEAKDIEDLLARAHENARAHPRMHSASDFAEEADRRDLTTFHHTIEGANVKLYKICVKV